MSDKLHRSDYILLIEFYNNWIVCKSTIITLMIYISIYKHVNMILKIFLCIIKIKLIVQ